MNVSSVKNLNGETFSAVQDAALTDVVQTNSGNWQDITAYQNASAGYLTAHQDLSPYYTTADANTMSGMLSGAIDYVSANAGGSYSAGSGINIVNDTISVDNTVIPDISAVSAMIDAASANGNLFIAEFGVTTRGEVDNAYIAGKYIVCYWSSNGVYIPLTELNNDIFRFNNTFIVRYLHNTPYCTKNFGSVCLDSDSNWYYESYNATSDWDETNTNSIRYIENKPDLSNYVTTSTFDSLSGDWEDTTDVVQTNSATWGQGGGSTPTYEGFSGLIDTIDSSGLFALSAGNAQRADVTNRLSNDGTMGVNILQSGAGNFYYMPATSPWTTAVAKGIYSPLQYATGACLAMTGNNFGAYFKGNEWYVSNTAIGQMLRGEVHQSRGVHLSGANSTGTSFDLSIHCVSGTNNKTDNYNWKLERGCVSGKATNGEWRYGVAEDAALRTVSSKLDTSAFTLSALNDASANNIVLTASLPATPDANTLYLIPET